MAHLRAARTLAAVIAVGLASCDAGSGASRDAAGAPPARAAAPDTLVIFLAASLTRPMQPLLDSFAVREGAVVQRESGGSLEHARKLTELERVPDVIALADEEVFPQLLVPAHVQWYAAFARDRMVVAYTDRSRHAGEITAANWMDILARPGVEVGRGDPDNAPAGYRALLMLRLAERYYRRPALAERLVGNAPPRNVRPNAAELAALLRAGELDYIYEYESVARANAFRFVRLPPEIDLGSTQHESHYARTSVRVRGRADSATVIGRPIRLAASIPVAAPHPRVGERFLALMLGPEGRAMLRAGFVDVLEPPSFHGSGVPLTLRAIAGS